MGDVLGGGGDVVGGGGDVLGGGGDVVGVVSGGAVVGWGVCGPLDVDGGAYGTLTPGLSNEDADGGVRILPVSTAGGNAAPYWGIAVRTASM